MPLQFCYLVWGTMRYISSLIAKTRFTPRSSPEDIYRMARTTRLLDQEYPSPTSARRRLRPRLRRH